MRIITSIALATTAVHGSLSVESECNGMISEAREDIDGASQMGKELILSMINENADSDIVFAMISDTNSGFYDRLQRLESDLLGNNCFDHGEIFEDYSRLQDRVNAQTEAFSRHLSTWSFMAGFTLSSIERVKSLLPAFERETGEVARSLKVELEDILSQAEAQLHDMEWDTRSFLSDELEKIRNEIADLRSQLNAARDAAVRRWDDGADVRRAHQELRRQEIEEQNREYELESLRDVSRKVERDMLHAERAFEVDESMQTFESAAVRSMEKHNIYPYIAAEVEEIRRRLSNLKSCVDTALSELSGVPLAINDEVSYSSVWEAMASDEENFESLENKARTHIPSLSSIQAKLDPSCHSRVEQDLARMETYIQSRIAEIRSTIQGQSRYRALKQASQASKRMHAAETREEMEQIASDAISSIRSLIVGDEADGLVDKIESERDRLRDQLMSMEAARQCAAALEAAIQRAHDGLAQELQLRTRNRRVTVPDTVIMAIIRSEGPKHRDAISAAAANCPANLQHHADETIKHFDSFLRAKFDELKVTH